MSDLLVRAARVHGAPGADAVAISGHRIDAVGPWDEIRWLGGETVEVPAGLILPGFQDAHIHVAEGGRILSLCDLHDVSGLAAYLEAVVTYGRRHPDRPWIEGGGWTMSDFPGGTPHREPLDAAVPDRPVLLESRDGHDAWVNSRALEAAGIDRRTPDPPRGRIGRDPDGETSGVLHEAAVRLVADLLPEPSGREWEEAILAGQGHLLALGVTAWQDVNVFPEWVEAYRRLADDGRLIGRATIGMHWDPARGLEQIAELVQRRGSSGRLRVETVKLFQDGIVENGSASMLEPYTGSESRGVSNFEPEELNEIVSALDAEGFQVHVHAIGDRAVREALDAFEVARVANGVRDARHTIAHIQVVHPDDVPRFAELDVIPNGQPYWACLEPQMVELTLPVLGPERSARQYPFGSLLRTGARLAFGSDWTVSTADPLAEMAVAVTRQPPDEPEAEVLLPEERLTPGEAIEAFTIGSARVNRLEDVTAAVEPGRLADLVVVDRDILEPGSMEGASAAVTIVGGRIVHGP
ncbi:MAG TPA: amidohydrolase [Actinomycetota bacterium]